MDIYSKSSRWKIYIAIAGATIVIASFTYTNYLAKELGEGERARMEIWALAQEQTNLQADESSINLETQTDQTLSLKVFQTNTTIPVIMVDERGEILGAQNYGKRDKDIEFLKKRVEWLEKKGSEPFSSFSNKIYYEESSLLTLLNYFPLIQLGLVAAFILFGYSSFSAARRSEQNQVWVGMAKETAHQLGTPISAILAWMEHLRSIRENDPEVEEVLDELNKDINRLDLVADRFSKIGSSPVLASTNLLEELNETKNYMARRAPRKVVFQFPDPDTEEPIKANINAHLFDWVIENLLRNALDAMDGKGIISAKVYKENGQACIDISDTGKGIPHSKFKTVFKPGYSTKTRGWGLGLSLSKRIIEQYHQGKIFVSKSEENKGTTFTVRLPMEKD